MNILTNKAACICRPQYAEIFRVAASKANQRGVKRTSSRRNSSRRGTVPPNRELFPSSWSLLVKMTSPPIGTFKIFENICFAAAAADESLPLMTRSSGTICEEAVAFRFPLTGSCEAINRSNMCQADSQKNFIGGHFALERRTCDLGFGSKYIASDQNLSW